jgi:hypothetical protein
MQTTNCGLLLPCLQMGDVGWDDVVRVVAVMAKTPADHHTARAAAR